MLPGNPLIGQRGSGAPRAYPSPSGPGQCRTGVRPEEGAGWEPILSRTDKPWCGSRLFLLQGLQTPCHWGEIIDLGSFVSDLDLGWKKPDLVAHVVMSLFPRSSAHVGCPMHRNVTRVRGYG